MPEMQLSGDPDLLPIEVLAYMAFPNDEDARNQLIASTIVTAAAESPDGEIQVPAAILKMVVEAPGLPAQAESVAQQAKKSGFICGNVLLNFLELSECTGDVSLAKSQFLTSKYLSKAKNHFGDKVANAEKSVRAAWKSHRSVAHLWAAQCLIVETENSREIVIEKLHSEGGFERLVAIAREIYIRTKRITLTSRAKFDIGEVWLVPEIPNLPDANIRINGLSSWMKEGLKAYVRRKR